MNRSNIIILSFVLVMGSILFGACRTADSLKVGDAAPAIDLPSADGRRVALNHYQGKPVLLYFHMAMG